MEGDEGGILRKAPYLCFYLQYKLKPRLPKQ